MEQSVWVGYLLLPWQGAISKVPTHRLFSCFIWTRLGPYVPQAGVAVAQGVYLLLIGRINGESGPSSVPNLPSCLCLGRHGNWYSLSSKNLIGWGLTTWQLGREGVQCSGRALSPLGAFLLIPDNAHPNLYPADATYFSIRQSENPFRGLFSCWTEVWLWRYLKPFLMVSFSWHARLFVVDARL